MRRTRFPLLILFFQNFPTVTIFKTSPSVTIFKNFPSITIFKNFPQCDNFSKNFPPARGRMRKILHLWRREFSAVRRCCCPPKLVF